MITLAQQLLNDYNNGCFSTAQLAKAYGLSVERVNQLLRNARG